MRHFPRVPMDRRIAAFAVDSGVTCLLSSLGGSGFYIPFFLVVWFGLRVALVERNKGQSLGRWAFDTRVIEPRYGSTPGLKELVMREAIAGAGVLLVLIGLMDLSPTNGFILVALLPLLIDCAFAWLDNDYRQALHDRLARTLMVQTRRGYSLDIKLKKLFAQANRRVK